MPIITNADADLRIEPNHRVAMEEELARQGQHQDIEAEGRRRARMREHKPVVLVPGADTPIKVDGEEFQGTAPAFVIDDEPDVDATVMTLRKAHVVQYVHKPWWPFRARGAKFGLYPVMGPKAWASIFETGTHCLRCLGQHQGFESFPEECGLCGLTAAYRARVIEMLETMKELEERGGPNRAQRRAMQRQQPRERRTKGGLILPGMGV